MALKWITVRERYVHSGTSLWPKWHTSMFVWIRSSVTCYYHFVFNETNFILCILWILPVKE